MTSNISYQSMFDRAHILKQIRATLPCDCVQCGQASDMRLPLCSRCDHDLPRQGSQCLGCAYPLTDNNNYCGHCLMSKNQIYVTKSAFRYEGTIAQLLHRFKFKGDLSAGQLLAQLTAAELTDSLPHRPDVIIPVPLHWRRLILRGFNQSLLFAKTLAPNLNATLIRQGCSRQRHTQSQSVLKGHERTRNVKRCFRVKSNVSDYHVAIVDDIYTTGSTTYALADTLIKAGAANVEILCCARAVLNG